ncbi:MFS transporter [Streptomyces iconiensis]|uniref:Multidrug efflux pump Tap n=1 Tax=Streptomyces iconiensis TaxID=1384038 RepID=A0ABT7A931_9ACTN|nr:MFS transporter [Streptomyces iconiensis]MDJ1137547.1 MFS transporter [Streptomyces iconiensis]
MPEASAGKPVEAGPRTLRPVAGLLTAIAVALTGTRISAISIPWFVLVTTGSATQTGVVAFCEMAPYVVVKALTGPLVDRFGPRVTSWTTDLTSAAAAVAIPVLHATDQLSFPSLLVLVAVIGAVRGPGDLAKQIMVPEAAERSRIRLERATGLEGTIERLASTVGPAAGGALVAALGPMAGLAVNAACFALGSLLVAACLPRGMGRPVPQAHAGTEADGTLVPGPGYWRRFGEGFTFLRGDPLLATVVVLIAVVNFLDAAFMSVLLPVWAHDSGHGPAAIGQVNAAQGILGMGGSLIAAAIAHRMRRRPVFFAGFLLAGAPRFLILATDQPMWVVLAVFAVGGFGAGFLNPILGALAFERVPRPLLGRVKALGDSLAWAGIPLGGLAAGAAVAAFGLVPVLLTGGALYFLTTNLAGLRPEWREMDRARTQATASGTPHPEPPPQPAPTARAAPSPADPSPADGTRGDATRGGGTHAGDRVSVTDDP